ncbi:OmpH family outer membrane protein [Alphaproteobacteria bacterium LSUCC0684]
MKVIKAYRGLALVLGMLCVALSSAASAQVDPQQAPSGIAVVDMKQVLQQSDAMVRIRAVLDEQNALFQAQVSKEELELREAEKKLNEDRENLSEAEFNTRLSEFEQRVVRIQQSIQIQKDSFERSIVEAQEKLEQELIKIISEIAQERGLAVVLQRQVAVIYDTSLDISDSALARLNERTKNLVITRTTPKVPQ